MADEEIKKFEKKLRKQRKAAIKSHAIQLAEHFDSVQIICTSQDAQDGAMMHSLGIGSYYTRMGAVDEFLRMCRREQK